MVQATLREEETPGGSDRGDLDWFSLQFWTFIHTAASARWPCRFFTILEPFQRFTLALQFWEKRLRNRRNGSEMVGSLSTGVKPRC